MAQIRDILKVQQRFLRSAHIGRDFKDPGALDGYVVTPQIAARIDRLADGLGVKSGRRAWRITGDYGSGKSSFALLLACLFAGRDSDLPPQVTRLINVRGIRRHQHELLPVLITGSRVPLATAILTALAESLDQNIDKRAQLRCLPEIREALNAPREVSDDVALTLLLEASTELIVKERKTGLLLVIDELGKFLEFSALHPERQDIYLLQQLAEISARSGDTMVFTVGLLHQGFNAYADTLSQTGQREWEKIAGRFEEMLFEHPLDQISHIIGAALNVAPGTCPRGWDTQAKAAMRSAIDLGWYGAGAPITSLTNASTSLYPLHPSVVPILVRLFSRCGQNERSLFSFLLSNEPFGLQGFAEQEANLSNIYRLHDLYDYVAANFGYRLSVQSYRNHWNHIESLVQSFPARNEIERAVVKTVGLLNLLNAPSIVPTDEAISLAVADEFHASPASVAEAVARLKKEAHVLYSRGKSGGYCLWSHTSVDLDAAYEEAGRAVGTPRRVANLIKDRIDARPIVARRHYIQTGNLRHFDLIYCSPLDLDRVLSTSTAAADGRIVIPLCETAEEVSAVSGHLLSLRGHPDTLVGVTEPLGSLAGLVQEVERWTLVQKTTQELKDDRYAAEEVNRRLACALTTLEKRVQYYIGLRESTQAAGEMPILWFYEGRGKRFSGASAFLSHLSTLCDELYPKAPCIHNELVNRRSLSSAAAAARMRLIKLMFSNGQSEWLGLDPTRKPPEMSIYLSVLKNTGLHQQRDGSWYIGESHHKTDAARCRVLPTLHRIREIVQAQVDARVNIAALFDELRKPPYGVLDGLIPLFLTVFAIAHEKDVAFYKDGSFVRELNGETMLLLTKAPERFEIQYCKIEGIRAEVFERLLSVLEVEAPAGRNVELLDVVKNLCVFVAQLPAYVLNTKKLSSISLAVRDAILSARDPARLLFADLPKACGFEPVTAHVTPTKATGAFVKTLRAALDDLRAAFPELQERMRVGLRGAFDLPGTFQQFRTALASRSEQVLVGVAEPKLRAFCLRFIDDSLSESDWLESIGSYLVLKPPSKWHDAEEELFSNELAVCATRFHHVESIVFAAGKAPGKAVGVRLAITQADGIEHEQVFHYTAEEEHRMKELEHQFETLLTKEGRVGLAAASRAILTSFNKRSKASHE